MLASRKNLMKAAGLGLVASLGLAACSGGASEDPAAQEGPVEITFSSWLRGSAAAVDAYNESQDDIEVTFQEVASSGDNYPQLTNQVAAGNAPDVITVEYPRVAEMASQGVLADISDVAGDFVAENYAESIQSLVNFGGSTWAVPFDAGVLQLYYRTDLFEEYGIEVPTTWAEYKEAAATVAEGEGDAYLGASIVGDPALYAALSWQSGAQWNSLEGEAWGVDIDSDATQGAMAIHQEMMDEAVTSTAEWETLQQMQADGEILSVISGSWYSAGLTDSFADQSGNWAVAPLPSADDEPASAMYGGSTFGVSTNSEKQEAAAEFIQWMTTDPAAIEARLSEGASSIFPVNEEARAAAAEAFDTEFFGGQDIYQVSADGLEAIPSDWVWGPSIATTFTTLVDESAAVKEGNATLADIFAPAEEATIADMESNGLSIAE